MTRGAARVIDPGDAEWVTQDQAALLTGVPLSTIDWWSRSGKIESRPRQMGPTINRVSLLDHVADVERQARERAERRAKRSRSRRRPGADWITTTEAASILGVSRPHVPTVARREGLRIVVHRSRVLLHRDEVEALVRERARWISWTTAMKLTGFGQQTIAAAVEAGLVERRGEYRTRTASLSRESVEAWAAEERLRRQHAAAEKAARRARSASGPPDDQHGWMTVRSAGVLLGLSRARVGQLIAAERLPAVRVGTRWWLRYDHVLSALAGREHRVSRAAQ